MNIKNLILGFALSLTILSCNKEENGGTVTAEDAKASAQIDAMNDDVSNIVEEQEAMTYDNSTSGKTPDSANSELTACATITRVPAFGTPLTPGQTVTKTIDFGTGCTLDNGNVLSGQIVITFVFQPNTESRTINYSFVNFFHNGIEFDGNKTFTRLLVATNPQDTPHPSVTMNMDLTATFPNGAVYHRVGQRVREIIEGFGTLPWADNVYEITGSWTTTGPNGGTQTSTITTPLHVKMSCIAVHKPLTVSGIITIVRNNTTATLDFGNGECDNLAVLTVNGNTFNIVIGN
ncbi:hypothetical protein [Flavobacterium wongokense]|uniref:hypothetical protein n=1 Tax=Flavobacterium wongokense TaxID=2910674 RepID=UPI001F3645C2|nr:hypothetical protein [Flavobacterium sp. WG47]MCF6131019.1 hypothetical protein [Flavobacterium sp. WG47]